MLEESIKSSIFRGQNRLIDFLCRLIDDLSQDSQARLKAGDWKLCLFDNEKPWSLRADARRMNNLQYDSDEAAGSRVWAWIDYLSIFGVKMSICGKDCIDYFIDF